MTEFPHRIVQHEAQNAMSIQNLAIVFGPTLFGQGAMPVPGANGNMNGVPSMADASFQNKVRTAALDTFCRFAD